MELPVILSMDRFWPELCSGHEKFKDWTVKVEVPEKWEWPAETSEGITCRPIFEDTKREERLIWLRSEAPWRGMGPINSDTFRMANFNCWDEEVEGNEPQKKQHLDFLMMVHRISNFQFHKLWPLLPKTMHSAVDFEGWKLADEEDKEEDDDDDEDDDDEEDEDSESGDRRE